MQICAAESIKPLISMSATKTRESDLYGPVKAFLLGQGYSVKGEIGACDVVAVRADEPPLIVELKTAFNLQLVLQGIDRQAISDSVYLAIAPPRRRQLGDIKRLCRRLGLGLLLVTARNVEAVADPEPYRPRKDVRRKVMLLKEFAHRVGDPETGGSARAPRMTAYRQDALRCIAHIAATGPSKVAVIRTATGVERTAAILQNDVYGWFVRIERGIYDLSPKGRAGLTTFAAALARLSADAVP